MPIPPILLEALTNPQGGRVVLIIGAGTSVEPPTCLPLSDECALDAHRKLVADEVLPEPCEDPNDLSSVADAVLQHTGSQWPLVTRLPRAKFRNAEPNEGHLLAAAMLRERALSCVLTLNFDLAMSSALTNVGNRGEVSIISGPEDHGQLGVINLIYLHRNVDADPEQWVIRTSALNEEWRGAWEEVIVTRVLASPVVVFVGLGSPAGVLIESTHRIRDALPASTLVLQVGPGRPEDSAFFDQLDLSTSSYLRLGWVEFMTELSERLVEEFRHDLERECENLILNERLDTENSSDLSVRIANLGLLKLGRIRARWTLDDSAYGIHNLVVATWMADLLLAIGLMERISGFRAHFFDDGVVEFRENGRIMASIVMAHGRGMHRWTFIDHKIRRSERFWRSRSPKPRFALISGVLGGRQNRITLPDNIIVEESEESISNAIYSLRLYTVDEIRQDTAIISRILE